MGPGVNSLLMKELVERQTSPRVWLLSTAAVLFSTASAFGFLVYFAMRLSVVDLLDKPGHHVGVPFATYWLIASLFCFIGTIVTTTLALRRWAGVSRLSRFIGRFVLAAILSTILTVLMGLLLFWIISAFSSGVVQ
jgi:hypothetical protein